MGDQFVARPLFIKCNTTLKDADKHACLEWYSNLRFQSSGGP
jgi:hypothetical protein